MNVDSCVVFALLGGGALLGRLVLTEPAGVPELVERIDMPLARKICALYRGECSEAAWRQMCTARSMWHMIGQARLMTKIVIEILKVYPGELDSDTIVPLPTIFRAVGFAGWLSLLEVWRGVPSFVHGREFVTMFAQLYYIAESAIVSTESM